jgi:hypothetical protein
MPDEDDWRSLLMTFRFFWQAKEPSHFGRVVNIIAKHTGDSEVHAYHERLRQMWKSALFRGAMFLHTSDGVVDADAILDLWLNSHYFHSDEEKERTLNRLSSVVKTDFVRYMLVDAVLARSRVLFMLGDLIDQLDATTT